MAWACVCVCDLITKQSNRQKEKIPKEQIELTKAICIQAPHIVRLKCTALEANKRAIAYESFIIFEISEFSSHLGVVLSADKTCLSCVHSNEKASREKKKEKENQLNGLLFYRTLDNYIFSFRFFSLSVKYYWFCYFLWFLLANTLDTARLTHK